MSEFTEFPIPTKAGFEALLEQKAQQVANDAAAVASVVGDVIAGWAASASYAATSITRNADGVVTSATVVWPDGSAGVLTTTLNADLPAIDAYEITHVDSGVKVIQPNMTRDASGAVIAQPALTTEAI